MNLNQIEYFIAAAELQNFTEAGKRLHVSQTAITQQMKSLESDLGVKLFARNGRRVKLTEAGMVFLSESREVVKSLEKAKEKARRTDEGYSGIVNVGFLKGSEQTGISASFAEFRKIYPGIVIKFERADYARLFENVESGASDIVLNERSMASLPQCIESAPYREASVLAIVPISHPCSLKESVNWSDFSNDTIIELVTSSESKALCEEGFASCRIVPRDIIKVADAESVILTAAAGMGVGFLPEYDVNLTIGIPAIRAIPLSDASAHLKLYWNKNCCNSAANLLRDFLLS